MIFIIMWLAIGAVLSYFIYDDLDSKVYEELGKKYPPLTMIEMSAFKNVLLLIGLFFGPFTFGTFSEVRKIKNILYKK